MRKRRWGNKQELIEFIDKYEKSPKTTSEELGLNVSQVRRLYTSARLVLLTYDFTKISIKGIDSVLEKFDNKTLHSMVKEYKVIPTREFLIKYKIYFNNNLSTIIKKIAAHIGEPYSTRPIRDKRVFLGQKDKKRIYDIYCSNLKLTGNNIIVANRLTVSYLNTFYDKPPTNAVTIIKMIVAEFAKNNVGIISISVLRKLSDELLREMYDDYTKTSVSEFCVKYGVARKSSRDYIKYIKERLGIA